MKRVSVLMWVLLLSTAALAQKADAAFVMGASFVSNTNAVLIGTLPGINSTPLTLKTHNDVFLEGAVAFRVLDAKVASLYAELPVAGMSSQKATIVELQPAPISHLTVLFITPAAKVKLLPAAPVSPWFSIGGGWARYSPPGSGVHQNKGAFQYGGGLDFRTGFPRLGFRAEVRDFLTGDPEFGIFPVFSQNSGLHHHNILLGGGIVVRL
jgi:hypothetical protein